MRRITDRVINFLKEHNWRPSRKNIRIARATLRKRRKKHDPYAKEFSIRESAGNWEIIYGVCRVGGTITFVYSANNNQDLHLIITLAGHEVEEITKLYFDENEVTFSGATVNGTATGFYSGKVVAEVNLGSDTQTAFSNLVTATGGAWSTDHRQRGLANIYLKLTWNSIVFPKGLPEISFQVKGKKVYDPRTGTTVYSNNAALCVADYLMNTRYGVKIPSAELYMGTSNSDIGSLWYAADVCDEAVSLAGGGTEPRYTTNGYTDSGNSHAENIEKLCSAMGGFVTYSSNRWRFWPAKWRTPSVTLSESDFISEIRAATLTSRRDNFNRIRGTYISKDHSYEELDFPLVKNDTYKALDNNEEIAEDISLPFTTSTATAQRLAKIQLEKVRQAITVEVSCTLKAYQLEVGDNVNITYARFGWSSKIFEVIETSLFLQEDDSGGTFFAVKLLLKETASGVYDWNSGEETQYDLAPNTNLPNALVVAAPTGLTLTSGTTELYLRNDGTVFSRIKVSWTAPADAFVTSGGLIEIEHKKSSSGTWSPTVVITGDQTQFHILEAQDGVNYDVRIRASSAAGTKSSWVTSSNHTVVGKTAAPSDVTGLDYAVEESGLRFSWNAVSDLDVREYEIRRGASWAAGTVIARVRGTNYISPFLATGSYTYRIKAIDTSGNYSTNDNTKAVTIANPGVIQNLNVQVTDNNITLDWEEPASIQQPIARYKIYKGTAFATAILKTIADETLSTFQELKAGTYTYWVTAVDGAGNEGGAVSISTLSFGSQSYKFIVEEPFAEFAECTNVIVGAGEESRLLDLCPVIEHFPKVGTIGNIWTIQWLNPEAKVYPYQPVFDDTGSYNEDTFRARGVSDAFGDGVRKWTQTTLSKRPFLTRNDNFENRVKQNTDFSNAAWDKTTYPCSFSAPDVTATASAARHGVVYADADEVRADNVAEKVLEVAVEYNNNQYVWIGEANDSSWRGAIFDIQNGSVANTYNCTASIAARTGGGYYCKVTYTATAITTYHKVGIWFSNTSSSSSPPSYTPAGTEKFKLYGVWFRDSAADSERIDTVTGPQFRGINGRQGLKFLGAQYLEAILNGGGFGDVASGDAQITYVVVRPDKVSANAGLITDSSDRVQIRIKSTGKFEFTHDDGSPDSVESTSITAGNIYIVRIRVDGLNASISVNSGSGFGAEVQIASGNTALFASNLTVGANSAETGDYLFGTIGTIVTVGESEFNNKTDEIETALDALFFQNYRRLDINRLVYRDDTGAHSFTYHGIDGILGPANIAKTFQQHMDDNSFADLQDLLDAGYNYLFQPGPTAGSSVVYTKNLGVIYNNVVVSLEYQEEVLQGSCTFTPTIEISTDGSSWTTFENRTQVSAAEVKYIRVTIEVSDISANCAFFIQRPRLRVDAKIVEDSGAATLNASDTDGTFIEFSRAFYSVESIQLTMESTSVRQTSVNLPAGTYPDGFYAFAWDSANARVDGTGYWIAKGILAT